MPKTKGQKKAILNDLVEKVSKSKSIVFTKFAGLGVKDNEELRKELKKEGGEYLVTKKTLLSIALKENKIEDADIKGFDGQVAAVFGYEDEVSPAKIVDKYKKSLDGKVDFLGGILEGKYIAREGMIELAKLPSKQELYAKLVGSMNAPISGFVNALAGNLRGLVTVLKAVGEKK